MLSKHDPNFGDIYINIRYGQDRARWGSLDFGFDWTRLDWSISAMKQIFKDRSILTHWSLRDMAVILNCHFQTQSLNWYLEHFLKNYSKCMPQNSFDDKSILVQVMAWCHQATSHYLSQCWPRSMLPYGIARPQWVNLTQTIFYTICTQTMSC